MLGSRSQLPVYRCDEPWDHHGADLELRAIDMRIAGVAGKRKTAQQRDVLLNVLPVLEIPGGIDRDAARVVTEFLSELVAPHLVGVETRRRCAQANRLKIRQAAGRVRRRGAPWSESADCRRPGGNPERPFP